MDLTAAETAYLFRHALLRDAAYQLQPPAERAGMHELAFAVLESRFQGPPPDPGPEETALQPHPTDAIADDLALHARLAREHLRQNQAQLLLAQSLYLRRAALVAEGQFRQSDAARHWLELAGLLSGAEQADALRRAAIARTKTGDAATALALFHRALALLSPHTQSMRHARATAGLAAVLQELGHTDDAEQAYRQCLEVSSLAAPGSWRAVAMGNFGALLRDRGLLPEAEAMLRQSLALQSGTDRAGHQAVVLANLGKLEAARQRDAQAEDIFQRALDQARQVGNPQLEANILANMGAHASSTGAPARALQLLTESLRRLQQVGDRRGEGGVWASLAICHHRAGRLADARQCYGRALELHRETGNRRAESVALINLAGLLVLLADLTQAETCLVEALAIARATRAAPLEATALGELAAVYRQLGRWELSEQHFVLALQLHDQCGQQAAGALHQCAHALLILDRGDAVGARAAWNDGLRRLPEPAKEQDLPALVAEMRRTCARAGVEPFATPEV